MESSKRSTQRANGQKLTRRRIPLSCLACRIRKLKCNRENPCQNCIVRGDEAIASCTYAEKPAGRQSSSARSDAVDMRSRIGRLEKSILSIMADRNKISSSKSLLEKSTSESTSNNLDTAGGKCYSSDSRSTHWDAVLYEIGAMKDAWSEENDQYPVSTETLGNPPSIHRLSLLTGLVQPPDRSFILGEVPCKDSCLILINRFFDDYTPAISGRFILHKPTFLKQFNAHFADPSKTRIIWIGLLFSVLCLAMHSYIRNNELQDMPTKFRGNPRLAAETFRLHTAECLVISDITKPKTLLIETLHLHGLAEYCSEDDGSSRGIMLLTNTIMRLALQQGYHRDPSQYPNLTIFQREMRRRVWTMVNQSELLWAAQSGIPKQIKYAECDVAPASNIFEDELFEEMQIMPPSRPLTVHTDITYLVVKAKTMRAFGQVIEFQHTIEGKPYSEVMRLDMMLNKTREEVPPNFQLRSLEEMRGDSESLIMERFVIDQYYHKAICVLHRKYWNQSVAVINSSPLFYSRKVSAASSMALLENQATMHGGSKSCGPLERMKWYHFSMSTHDFLLAAMIISLDLSCEQVPPSEGSLQPSQKIQALERSRAIWAEIVNECSDAKRAVHVLDSVLTKLKSKPEYSALFVSTYGHGQGPQPPQVPETSTVQSSNLWDMRQGVFPFLESIELPPPTQPTPLNENMIVGDNNCAFLGVDTSMPLDFDWDAWDQFVNDDIFSAPAQ